MYKRQESDVASFRSELKSDRNKIKINATLSLGKRVYDAEDWADFRNAVKGYKDLADSELVFIKK